MKTKAILSVVFQKAYSEYSHYDYEKKEWVEVKLIPLNKYIGSGGHLTDDLQKAQVFGFSKNALKQLESYRKDSRHYEVFPVLIQKA